MEPRAAFARARTFLNYHPVAKWAALVAGVGTGVLYVALLMLLGLFLDLTVSRGDIPAYHRLTPAERAAFYEEWKEPLKHPRFAASQPSEQTVPQANGKDDKERKALSADLEARLKRLGTDPDTDRQTLRELLLQKDRLVGQS